LIYTRTAFGHQDHADMPQYIFRLSLQHPTFRLPSLKSIADLYGFPIRFVSEDKYRSVLVVELEKDEDAEKFLERGILVMYVSKSGQTEW
jgi:tRNA (guanine10-N2)-methyltransferase